MKVCFQMAELSICDKIISYFLRLLPIIAHYGPFIERKLVILQPER